MDAVSRKFDEWAGNGRAEAMEAGHGPSVLKFLGSVRLGGRFAFLDVGCGNGWLVRHMASDPRCRRAVGIDKSRRMVASARGASRGVRAEFFCADIESWKYRGRFDCALAMESLYYAGSVSAALQGIYGVLAPGGRLFCGTDYYAENSATARWSGDMGLRMHLLSRAQWRALFSEAGFEGVRTRRVTDPRSRARWKREMGTLFIEGARPGRR